MRFKKILISFALILGSFSCFGATTRKSSGLIDTEIGYVELNRDLNTKIRYKTAVNGIYKMIVKVNEHAQYSDTTTVSNSKLTVLGFSSITFQKSWIQLTDNKLSVEVLNLTGTKTQAFYQEVSFDASYSSYYKISKNNTIINKGNCYLAIRLSKLYVFDISLKAKKNPSYVECENNNINLYNNYLIYDGPENYVEYFDETYVSLIIRNHSKAFIIGNLEYDTSTDQYFNTIPLSLKFKTEDSNKIIYLSANDYLVSYSNLVMHEIDSIENDGSYFVSNNIFIPIGLSESDDLYEVEILFENVGYYSDTIVLKTSYLACKEHFGSCYVGDYCIYRGDQ